MRRTILSQAIAVALHEEQKREWMRRAIASMVADQAAA